VTLSDIMDIAVSALSAQRVRMAVTASNLANAETTRTAAGGPYQRRDPVFQASPVGGHFASQLQRAIRGVEVSGIRLDSREPIIRFEPGHPDADAQGNVRYPRVSVIEETTNMMSASRSYEANLVILRKARAMSEAALQIGR
jgi:flagellar basal-body rod protein FlgC